MAVIQDRFKSKSVLLTKEWDAVIDTQIEQLTQDELDVLHELVDSDSLIDFVSDAMQQEYERIPVPIEDWLSEYYLGDSVRALYKAWKDDLILLFSTNIYESVMLGGSYGSGKTEFAVIALLRMIYEASCLKDPAVSYGLASGSKIAFCVLSKTEQVAKAAIFDKLVNKIQGSEYFSEIFPTLNRMKDNKYYKGNEISFNKGLSLICGSSSDSSVLGANVMGGFIDELNFFQRTAKNATADSRYGIYGKAGKLFDQLKRRIRSRFQRFGKLPGLLIGASSKTTKDSLTEQFIREAVQKNDTTMFVRDYSILDVKPEAFSNKKFRVLVGNEIYSSKILAEDEEVLHHDPAIVEVPEEFRKDFELDILSSLRDLLGISTNAIHTFINKVEKLQKMKDLTREHPFSCPAYIDSQQWDSRLPYEIQWNKICNLRENGEWEPLLNPWAKRYVSLDPGLTGDAYCVCISHIAGLIPVTKHDTSQEFTEYLPYFIVDFILRIKGEPGEEILFRNVRRIIYEFSSHGYHIAKVTTDKFQSRDTLQILKEQGYNAEILSVDEIKDPYLNLRRVIYDERIKCYSYEILWEELRTLEEGLDKIDHTSSGVDSKDAADALCACIYALTLDATYSEPILPMKGLQIEAIKEDEKVTEKHDENFIEVKKQDTVVIDNKVVYKKKDKAELKPAYVKINHDGSKTDLTNKIEQQASYILNDILM